VWPEQRPITVDQLTEELNRAIQFPGLTNAWTMPIKTRIDMLSTGIKTPVGIKVMGDDLATLSRIGEEVEAVVRTVPGTLSAISERVVGGRYLDIRIDRLKAARYGINVGDIQEIIQTAVGGMAITETVEGLERYTVNVRYDRDFRSDIDSLKRVLVPGAGAGIFLWNSWRRYRSAMPRTASRPRTPAAPPGSMSTSRTSISAPTSRMPNRRSSSMSSCPRAIISSGAASTSIWSRPGRGCWSSSR